MILTIDLIDTDDEILVKAHDTVDFTTPLIKKQGRTPVTIHIAQELKIAPKDIFVSLKKVVGETIDKGEVLAQKKTLFATKVLESPYAGIIKEINHNDGTVILDIEEEKESIVPSFFKGEVTQVKAGSLSFKVRSAKDYPLSLVTTIFGGEVVTPKVADLTYLKEEEVAQKVVIAKEIKPHEQVKIDALGASGIVVTFDQDISPTGRLAVLKKGVGLGELETAKHPYCIIDKKNSTLYLYS